MTKKWINKKNIIGFYFIGIALFKMVCMCCFSSDYQDALFFPFVSQFLDGIKGRNYNPYEYYYANHMVSAFPYPSFMLFIESIPVWFIKIFSIKNLFLFHFIMKLPIFLFDGICAVILIKMYPQKLEHIALLYYTSPIIIYSGYMHGQLDIIPTAILLSSIYVLVQRKKAYPYLFSLLLALAVLAKQHTIAIAPVLFIFYGKRDGFWKSMKSFCIFIGLVLAGIALFWSKGFIYSVFFNKEQNQLLDVYIDYGILRFILPVFMILMLYLKAFYLDKINKELLLNYCGIVFAVFLAFVPPMPGWYTWIVPYIAIFFIDFGQDKYKNLFLYLALNSSYLLYFLFFHKTSLTDLYFCGNSLAYTKIENQSIRNVIFTIMTGLLLYTIYQMYRIGIASNSFYKRGNIPFSIGISGDSGSGKSQMLHTVEMLFGKKNVLEIEGDGDHKWQRGEEMWKFHTHLDPKANYLYRQAKDIQMLKTGKSVYRVEYDHKSGTFSNPHKIRPRKYIIVCGLHSLYLPQMRKCLDMKIYMDTDENLRRFWKIQRDISKRGYSREKILEQIERRMEDSKKYIFPQKKYADIIVRFYDKNLNNCFMAENYIPEISLKITVSSEIDLEAIVAGLMEQGINVEYDYEEDLDKQTVLIDGESINNCKINMKSIAEKNIPQIEELTIQNLEMDNLRSIVGLFILVGVSNKLREEI